MQKIQGGPFRWIGGPESEGHRLCNGTGKVQWGLAPEMHQSGEPDQALLLYVEGGRALEHAAQGGRGISLSLETLQTHLDVILSHLLQLTLPGRGGWTR